MGKDHRNTNPDATPERTLAEVSALVADLQRILNEWTDLRDAAERDAGARAALSRYETRRLSLYDPIVELRRHIADDDRTLLEWLRIALVTHLFNTAEATFPEQPQSESNALHAAAELFFTLWVTRATLYKMEPLGSAGTRLSATEESTKQSFDRGINAAMNSKSPRAKARSFTMAAMRDFDGMVRLIRTL